MYLLREVGDPASDWKSYSDSVQEPPVTQETLAKQLGYNRGVSEWCVSMITPVIAHSDIGIAYMDCKHAIMPENDIGREEGRGTTVGVGLTFR